MKRKLFSSPVFLIFIILALFAIFAFTANFLSSRGEREHAATNPLVNELFAPREHYRGTPYAEVVVVEYGEVECPYCKSFHHVMKRIVKDYNGKVVWIFRHFPIASHPKSIPEAIALECASEIAGEETFWGYLDLLFNATPSNNKMNLALLSPLAVSAGVPQAQFEECLESGRHETRIQNDRTSGLLWGVTKVPHIIIITKNGKEFTISGGASYEFTKNLIDIALIQE